MNTSEYDCSLQAVVADKPRLLEAKTVIEAALVEHERSDAEKTFLAACDAFWFNRSLHDLADSFADDFGDNPLRDIP